MTGIDFQRVLALAENFNYSVVRVRLTQLIGSVFGQEFEFFYKE